MLVLCINKLHFILFKCITIIPLDTQMIFFYNLCHYILHRNIFTLQTIINTNGYLVNMTL